jgi:hypothetical protein
MDEINSVLILLIILVIWEVVKSVFIFLKVGKDMELLQKTAHAYKKEYNSVCTRYACTVETLSNTNGLLKTEILNLSKDLDYYKGGYDRLAKGIQSLTDDNFNLINERSNLLKIVEELTPKEKVVKADKPFPDPNFLRKKPRAKKKV